MSAVTLTEMMLLEVTGEQRHLKEEDVAAWARAVLDLFGVVVRGSTFDELLVELPLSGNGSDDENEYVPVHVAQVLRAVRGAGRLRIKLQAMSNVMAAGIERRQGRLRRRGTNGSDQSPEAEELRRWIERAEDLFGRPTLTPIP